ncbi:MAG: thioredoxin [Rhodothermales bacterium]|nr:thioredoxin [Rhodothermales bacterium]
MKPLPVLLALLLAAGARAQAPDPATVDDQTMDMTAATELTAAEERVRALIAEDGVHVVHFWAPWCDNSINELRRGWYAVVEDHPDVTFTFVTVWNDGESGREMMDRYALPERVEELTQPDFGPSDDKAQRRRRFLGLPVTWIPTTWVFHQNGELAYAFNYGELEMDQVERALADVRRDW